MVSKTRGQTTKKRLLFEESGEDIRAEEKAFPETGG